MIDAYQLGSRKKSSLFADTFLFLVSLISHRQWLGSSCPSGVAVDLLTTVVFFTLRKVFFSSSLLGFGATTSGVFVVFLDVALYQTIGAQLNFGSIVALRTRVHDVRLLLKLSMFSVELIFAPVLLLLASIACVYCCRVGLLLLDFVFHIEQRRTISFGIPLVVFVLLEIPMILLGSSRQKSANIFLRLAFEIFDTYSSHSHEKFEDELDFLSCETEELRAHNTRSSSAPPSLVVFFLESVRASVLPMYNKNIPSKLTPFLAGLVMEEGVSVVEDLAVQIPNTMKSMYSLLCGIPAHPGIEWLEYSSNSKYFDYCLPKQLGGMGWDTRYFTPSSVGFQPMFGFAQSMDGQALARARRVGDPNFGRASFLGSDERVALSPVREWLASLNESVPGFAVIGSLSTHAPYTVANTTRAALARATVVGDAVRASFEGHSSKIEDYSAYLVAMHDTDDYLRHAVNGILSSSKGDNVFIVIMGDHGEGFGEHAGATFHGGTPYREIVHVPMIMVDRRKVRSDVTPKHISGSWSMLDVKSTLLKALIGFTGTTKNQRCTQPATLPFRRIMGSQDPTSPCSSVSSSMLDTSIVSCTNQDFKIMRNVAPSRLAVYSTTTDTQAPKTRRHKEIEITTDQMRKRGKGFLQQMAPSVDFMIEFQRIAKLRHQIDTADDIPSLNALEWVESNS